MLKNNKGFSLVELIIVIAIMAILSAALAPQLMKYIKNSRVSTDKSNCESIITSINTTLSNSDVYEEVMAATSVDGAPDYITFSFNGSKPTDYNIASLLNGEFDTELDDTVGEWPEVKSDGTSKFYCKVNIDLNSKIIFNVEVQTQPFTP